MSRLKLACIASLAMALGLASCNKKSNETRIAMIPKGTTHVFWKSVQAGAEKAGKELNVKIIWKGPLTENDASQQIGLVEQFASDNVSGICLAPLDANSLRKPVLEADAKKIPVVIFDSALNGEAGKDFVSFVATDNQKGGQLAGQEMVRLLKGKGKLVMIRYAVGSASTEAREKGFLEVVEKSNIQLIEKDRYSGATVGEAQKNAENMLDKLKEADGIFCPNESSTVGMMNVLKANGLAGGKKVFVGFDASPELVAALRSGDLQATVAQDPAGMGYKTVMTMVKHIRGEAVPQYVDTGCALVTKENLSDPHIKAMIGE